MLTEIEKFVLGGNIAHDLYAISKNENNWIISVSPTHEENIKLFRFGNAQEKHEQDLTVEGELIEYPLPIIGFDSVKLSNGKWHFCLNAADVEWGFISDWPERA